MKEIKQRIGRDNPEQKKVIFICKVTFSTFRLFYGDRRVAKAAEVWQQATLEFHSLVPTNAACGFFDFKPLKISLFKRALFKRVVPKSIHSFHK